MSGEWKVKAAVSGSLGSSWMPHASVIDGLILWHTQNFRLYRKDFLFVNGRSVQQSCNLLSVFNIGDKTVKKYNFQVKSEYFDL